MRYFPFPSCSGNWRDPHITQRITADMWLSSSKHARFLVTLIQKEINHLAIVKNF